MSSSRGPVILMYHGTPAGKPTSSYSIRAGLFAKHLDYLKRAGWKTARLKDLAHAGARQTRTVAITFDDGYADNFEGAFLPLAERDMTATWFITTDTIGGHAHWMGEDSPEFRMLDASQLRQMADAGMEIGSHSCSHPDLSTLDYGRQLDEMTRSKLRLEELIGQPLSGFAYPYGRFTTTSLKAVSEAGYNYACSTRPGWFGSETNPLLLRRVTVFSGDSAATLGRKLEFADNDVSFGRLARYYGSRLLSRLT